MIGLVAVSIVAGILLLAGRPARLDPREFFRPDLVYDIAARFPQEENGFVMAAWNYVSGITYEHIGSDMTFLQDGIIVCEDCYLPSQTLAREVGNCVAKSSLLASLLATKLPAERIHMIIGSYGPNRETGGHAWVELFRQNDWYLLETTKTPSTNIWVTGDSQYPLYDPGVMITPNDVVCADKFFCESLSSCDCQKQGVL